MFFLKKVALTVSILLMSQSVAIAEGIDVKNDFTNNGYNDLVWHDYFSGAIKIWEMEGTTVVDHDQSVLDTSNTNLVVKAFADFNNDGNPDILLHNANSGNVRVWTMDRTSRIGNINVLPSSNTNLKIIGAGDFDGDNNIDIAVFNKATGALRIWLMDGNMTRLANTTVIDSSNTNLTGEAVGDLNADGKPDILLRNNNTGNVRVWLMDGMTRSSNELVANSSNVNLKVRGVLDIDRDGKDDVFWSNRATGKVLMWKMDGVNKNGTNIDLGTVRDLAWDVGAGDGGFNVDDVATNVSLDTDTSATLLESDGHYYKLILSEPTTVKVYTTNSVNLDTYGYIYTSSGSIVAENDDGGVEDNFLMIKLLQAGTYYIKVHGYNAMETGAYTLHVEIHDPETILVTPNSSTAGYLVAGEIYYYEVLITESGVLTAETISAIDTYGYIYDVNWNLIKENDDSGEGNNFYLEDSVSSGTYYIRVEGYNDDEGDYTLDLSFVPDVT